MAFTATKSKVSVHGDQRVWEGVITADAASGVVSFGFTTITHLQWSIKSLSTACPRVRQNALAGGTASAGDVGVSGVASGDEFYLTVYGR